MAVAAYNAKVIQGDTWVESPVLTTGADVPVDLTGVTVEGNAKKDSTVIPLVCSVVSASNGAFRFGLPAGTTATMALGQWKYQVKFVHADSTVETIVMGQLVVADDVE